LVRTVQDLLLLLNVGSEQTAAETSSPFTPARIARRPEVLAAAADAVGKLKAFAQASGYDGGIPTPNRLAEAAEEATELRPRLIASALCSPEAFRQAVLEDASTTRKLSLRNTFTLVGIMSAIGFGGLLLVFVVASVSLRLKASTPGVFTELVLRVAATEHKYLLWSGMASMGILVMILIFLTLLVDLSGQLLSTTLVLWLFGRPTHRTFYLRMIHFDVAEKKRVLRVSTVCLLAIMAIVIANAVWIQYSDPDLSTAEFLARLSPAVTIVAPLFWLAPSVIYFRSLLKVVGRDRGIDSEASQRYLAYQLFQFLRIPVLISLVAWLVPAAFGLQVRISERYLVPVFEQAMIEHRADVAAFGEEDVDLERKQTLLYHIDHDILAAPAEFLVATPQLVDEIGTTVLPMIANMVAWLIVAAILTLIVTPYLMFRGIPRGVFYALLLFVTFHLENLFQRNAPSWFGLPQESDVAPWLVAFLIFANALFFDWVYESLTDPQATCPGCQTQFGVSARYCPECGLVQPEEQ
jgi:hypothetical protein